MPVTSRIHVIERGSAKKPIFTFSVPAGTHVQRLWTLARSAVGRSSMAKSITTDHTNASPISVVAIQPATGSPMRLPNSSRTTAPRSGSAGTIQMRSSRSRAVTRAA